ncbi:MAG: hypothetical protein U1F26_02705 [Lysobacterales bacterium]
MDARELIESYIAEVASELPRRQRNDLAYELRALLDEELSARAEAAGRPPDAPMALALLAEFGAPADVATRYRPPPPVIDLADSRRFWRLCVHGLLLLWGLGLIVRLAGVSSLGGALAALGAWWAGTVIPSLWWPGVLVIGFAASAWARRRWPQAAGWRPRAPDRLRGGRSGAALGMLGIACGVYLLAAPTRVLDLVWGGQAAPAAYAALSYSEPFREAAGPLLLSLLCLNLPLLACALVLGRRPRWLRRLDLLLSLATCAAMLWASLAGPIFLSAAADQVARLALLLIAVAVLAWEGLRLRTGLRPAPG